MCAICGIVNNHRRIDPELLRQMTNVMDYRGPDEEGFWVKEDIGLGHRRLKIIDLHTGRQPMANEDNTLFLVCNGEVYNFQELREGLEVKGHSFRSKSDGEVILHLYEEKGAAALRDIRGMFALAIWDDKSKELFLARDRLGQKPLVYALIPGGIIFASEIKALLLFPEVQKEVDPVALDLFFTYQAVPAPHTIFKGINKLEPAHYLKWKNGAVQMARYWDVDFTRKLRLKDEGEYAALLWERLTEATKLRMAADVPVGAFLSGGIDSSAVVGIMSGLSPDRVKTFAVGFDFERFSELRYARLAAERFGTEHHEFTVKPEVLEVLPRLVWHYNEPFGDSSMVPSYYVARETRRHVTVALNGDGGDESFAGYTRYWQTLLLERIINTVRKLPASGRRAMMSALLKGYHRYPDRTFFRIWKWVEETEKHGYDYAYLRRLTSFASRYKEEIYSPGMKERLAGFDALGPVRDGWAAAGDINLLEKMLYSDQHLYLPEVLNVKMDIATMANSLEGRSPFLDHRLVETAAMFPPGLKFRGLTSKYILKKSLQGFLPEEILRRQKMGFGVPVGEWFRGELKDYLSDCLLSDRFGRRGFFNAAGVAGLVREHLSGQATHTPRLWNLLVFELWCRLFLDGESPG